MISGIQHKVTSMLVRVRTTRFGLKGLQLEGTRLWGNLPSKIKDSKTKNSFKVCFKKHMIDLYGN